MQRYLFRKPARLVGPFYIKQPILTCDLLTFHEESNALTLRIVLHRGQPYNCDQGISCLFVPICYLDKVLRNKSERLKCAKLHRYLS